MADELTPPYPPVALALPRIGPPPLVPFLMGVMAAPPVNENPIDMGLPPAPTIRIRVNNLGDPAGTVNPVTLLAASSSQVSWSTPPANMPAVAWPNYLVLVAEPNTANEEITWVTGYTPGATVAQVLRGQEGSVALAHLSTPWVHGPTMQDFTPAPPGSLVLIQAQILTVAQPNFSFTNIPQTFNHLILKGLLRTNYAAQYDAAYVVFNGDTGPHYGAGEIYAAGSSAAAQVIANQAYGLVGYMAAGTDVAGTAGTLEVEIPGYTLPTFNKAWRSRGGFSDGTSFYQSMYMGSWASNAPITSVLLGSQNGGSFVIGSAAWLYGQT